MGVQKSWGAQPRFAYLASGFILNSPICCNNTLTMRGVRYVTKSVETSCVSLISISVLFWVRMKSCHLQRRRWKVPHSEPTNRWLNKNTDWTRANWAAASRALVLVRFCLLPPLAKSPPSAQPHSNFSVDLHCLPNHIFNYRWWHKWWCAGFACPTYARKKRENLLNHTHRKLYRTTFCSLFSGWSISFIFNGLSSDFIVFLPLRPSLVPIHTHHTKHNNSYWIYVTECRCRMCNWAHFSYISPTVWYIAQRAYSFQISKMINSIAGQTLIRIYMHLTRYIVCL